MPKVMKPHMRERGAPEERLKDPCREVRWVEEGPHRGAKEETVVAPDRSQVQALSGLLASMLPEGLDGLRREGNLSAAPGRFGFAYHECAVRPDDRLLNTHHPTVQIHILPSEC